mgnify:CR=1 FL=1
MVTLCKLKEYFGVFLLLCLVYLAYLIYKYNYQIHLQL